MAKVQELVSQCPKCNLIEQRMTDGRMTRQGSICQLPSVPKKICITCAKKEGVEYTPTQPQVRKKQVTNMKAATEEGIERGTANANEDWKEMALECVRVVATKQQTFTVNEVREMVEKSPIKTHSLLALGGVMRKANNLGWIEGTDERAPSLVTHGSLVQVWRSRLYKPEEQIPV